MLPCATNTVNTPSDSLTQFLQETLLADVGTDLLQDSCAGKQEKLYMNVDRGSQICSHKNCAIMLLHAFAEIKQERM